MTFTDFEFKSGTLGQGCYIHGYATRPGFYHCRLPATMVLSLMDLGRWQLLNICDNIFRDPTMISERWRVDNALATMAQTQSHLSGQGGNPQMLAPLASNIECYWRANRCIREQVILRLGNRQDDALSKRLSRVVAQLPDIDSSALQTNEPPDISTDPS